MTKDLYVISLGGSLIVPGEIDVNFLRRFRAFVLSETARGKRFIIICGGGKTARNYQAAGKMIARLASVDIDWLGIHATRINGHLLRSIFAPHAHPRLVKPDEAASFKQKILVGAGWKPGRSTDYCAVMLAKKFGAKTIINLSNITYVFDRDPNRYKNAKPIKETDWRDFRKLLPKHWSPGLSSPFDPVASELAEKSGLEVAIISGHDLKSVKNFLADKPFKGTRIS